MTEISRITAAAKQLLEDNQSFALAWVVTQTGSTPRGIDAKMLVRRDGSIEGTIGGGLVEGQAIAYAKQVIADKIPYFMFHDMDLQKAAEQGMACGGQTEVMIDYVDASQQDYRDIYRLLNDALAAEQCVWLGVYLPSSYGPWRDAPPCRQCLLSQQSSNAGNLGFLAACNKPSLNKYDMFTLSEKERVILSQIGSDAKAVIFGAGHVGEKLTPVLSAIGFKTVVLDDRQDFANPQRLPLASEVKVIPDFNKDIFDGITCDDSTYCIIVTRGHAYDKVVLAQCLRQNPRYIGMIGSSTKRAAVYNALLAEGFTQNQLDKVYSPIGLDIGAKTPEEIAISIAAELIKVRHGWDK